ncbi:PREDICTED: complement factor H isoform X3 [Myotis brandtii]|uniref:complement factor H isoform X3 n=1 Tax=Myotis brandtii TaxID=109478 RepID=UPI000703C2A8|nr:PREDICTED: complement factor H isoform X3 [Myotis brandtii]
MQFLVTVILTLWVSWARGQETCLKSKVKIENGFIAEPEFIYLLNQKVKYKCKQGYVTEDGHTSGSITCLQNGWSAQPRCIKRECIVPDIEQNLIAHPRKEKYVIGDVLKFSCRNRFLTLIGADSLQCYHFGWSPSPPTCKEEVQSCDQPPRLRNGKVADTPKGEYEHGEVVEYVCNPRFLMKGARKIQCVDGEWTPLPVCVATVELRTCKLPKTIAYETKLSDRIDYEHNKKISYTCGRKSEQKHSVCVNGKWEPEVTCTEAPRCPPPPQIPNSQHMALSVNFQEGEKISILCQENFLIQEGEEIVCQDGRWQSIPRCVENTLCSQPPHVEHGSIISSRETLEPELYAHGTTLSYICKDGFKLSKEDGITCHRGKWSAPPQCVEIICPSPPSYGNAILIGRKKNSYKSGEQVDYGCPDYYQMYGSNFVECRDGIWIGTPTCKDVSCGSPPTVQNAFIPNQKPRYRHGDTARYECRHPLGLFGKAVVTCLSGNWTDPPECKEPTGKCGRPPAIDNGDVTTYISPFYASGSSVEYQCQAFYELEGNRRITCRDGQWSEPPKCLGACVISEKIMKEHNIQLRYSDGKKIYSRSNDYVEFVCRFSYRRVSPASAFRAQCREGKLEYPTCG